MSKASTRADTADDDRQHSDHDRLRQLLVGSLEAELAQARAEIAALRQLLTSSDAQIERCARALPEAVRRHAGQDTALQQSLQPDIEHVLFASVREHPDRMAEAIYPLLGPAVRKMIERLFSRSRDVGTQPWNVEQLFLIHRVSGLLLAHVEAEQAVSADPDMVSGMLSAIRSYVQDAFGSDDFDGLRVMHVGEVTIRVEWGPQAVLAAVVRGIEPPPLQPAMEQLLAGIHDAHTSALDDQDGDPAVFGYLSLQLRNVLREHTRREPRRPVERYGRWAVLGALVLAAVSYASYHHDLQAWNRLVDRLDAEPGLVVLASERSERHVRLLADPSARAPSRVVADLALAREGDLTFTVHGYRDASGGASGERSANP